MNSDKARRRVAIALCGSIVVLGSSGMAHAYTGQELAPHAQVSLQHARAIALKARPGTITDQELERESGGSGLRYSFDIRKGGKTYEVGVDAKTGVVLENQIEGPTPD